MIATKKHYAFRGRLMSLLVLTHCGVSSRPQLPQESPCFFFAGIAYTTYTTISYSSTSIKNIQPLHSLGEWRVVTPRKYKPIFFVRCKSCRSIPGPAGIARVRRPHRTILRKVDENRSLRTTSTYPLPGQGGWGRARGKHPPGAILDGEKCTYL